MTGERLAGRPPIVRLATVRDAGAIALVHVESWRAAYRGIVPDTILDALSVEGRTIFWSEQLGHADPRPAWVAEADGEIVAIAQAGPCRDADLPPGLGEVYLLYVLPAAWGRGLGAVLLRRCVDDLRSRNRAPVVLWVLTDNERARRFYEREGWRLDGGRRVLDFDGTPIEEVRYRLELPDEAARAD